ncbi:MAG: hypothetical protein QXX19_01850 [Candidatus Caldarchaeum sp.]
MARRIVSRTEVPIAYVAALLEKQQPNLTTLQARVLQYCKKYTKLPADQAEKLVEKLVNEVGLTRREAVQVADTCPTTVDELRAVLSGYKRLVSFLLFSEEKMKTVISLVEDALNNRLK